MNNSSIIARAQQQWDFLAILVGMVGGFGAVAVTRMVAAPQASVWFATALAAAFCASNVALQRARQKFGDSTPVAIESGAINRLIEMTRRQMDPVAIAMAIAASFVGVAMTRMMIGPNANVWVGAAVCAALLGAQITLQRARKKSSNNEATTAAK